jgi:hypothetical protein
MATIKKPKRPKKSSSVQVWQNWETKMKSYIAKKKAKAERPKKIEAISRKYS